MKELRNTPYIAWLTDIDKTMRHLAGGKGANLGELIKIDGIHAPAGFCITTNAFKEVVEDNTAIQKAVGQLSQLHITDRVAISAAASHIRILIEHLQIPGYITSAISRCIDQFDENDTFAVRSSATAEDLESASFAGQQDSYLNIRGAEAVLHHVGKCWASLFTDRAVMYRMQNGFGQLAIQLAVVVQKMVHADAAGIMFTADPVTSNRKIISIDASYGLGEALVSGLVTADNYRVQDGKIAGKNITKKQVAVRALDEGGTTKETIDITLQQNQVLSDEQIHSLASTGRMIEKHFGLPQDIEWCLHDDQFYIVQSRPITTLYPIPHADDNGNRVYVSVGHQQMMTDAMKPLGLSFFMLTTRANMRTAGGRLFVDITQLLSSPEGRRTMVDVLGKSDPLIRDALTTIIQREGFIPLSTATKDQAGAAGNIKTPPLPNYQALHDYDPAIVDELIRRNEKEVENLKQQIVSRSGPALFDFILDDIGQLKKVSAESESFGVIMTGMNATTWVNEKMEEWLGEKSVADILAQSAPNNITSEMGLALLDVADAIRPFPDIIEFLQQVVTDDFREQLLKFHGGAQVRDAIDTFLARYGMRCAGEIDITRPRWSEKPAALIPMIITNTRNFAPGESRRRYEQGRREAQNKEKELLSKLKQLPGGDEKARETKRMIGHIRNFSGYREYPKYGIVSRYFIYKKALLNEAEKLVRAGVIAKKEDIYFFTFEELREVVQSQYADDTITRQREEEFKYFERLKPPRVMTSDGEIITGAYRRDNIPAKAIVGLPVSAGVVEGKARVILSMEQANLEEGDILVTVYTDPSWTPLFVSIKGLVTEVGGLMTHGAVIAREYGLPAVVGMENATNIITDGQWIRVNGTEGYVEIIN